MAATQHTQSRRNVVLGAAIILSALDLRTAVTSVCALLQELEQSLGLMPWHQVRLPR